MGLRQKPAGWDARAETGAGALKRMGGRQGWHGGEGGSWGGLAQSWPHSTEPLETGSHTCWVVTC